MPIDIGFSVPLEPGYYASIDPSKAGSSKRKSKILVIGQKLLNGTAKSGEPIFVPGISLAQKLFYTGSMLERIIYMIYKNYPMAEVWALPFEDPSVGTQASVTISVSGQAEQSGAIHLYIGGQYIYIPVNTGDTDEVIAARIASYINQVNQNPLAYELPVTASVVEATITLTAKHKGTIGNTIDIRINHKGLAGGEYLPNGIGISINNQSGILKGKLSGGTGIPTITFANIENQEFDTIIYPYTDASLLMQIKELMADRWSPLKMLYGHVISAKIDNYTNLESFISNLLNDPHLSIYTENDIPNPAYEVAGAIGANVAQYEMDTDDQTLAKGFTGLPLVGILSPQIGQELTIEQKANLLTKGLATLSSRVGTVYISRARTTYTQDMNGNPDDSLSEQRTLAILQRIIRTDKAGFMKAFAGAILVQDASSVSPGIKVCSPDIARGWFAQQYDYYQSVGLVQNKEKFLQELLIEIDTNDPNRLNVLYPPILSGWLAVTAMRVAFMLY